MITTHQQYIYVLKLIPSLLDETVWTEREHKIVENHFNHLRTLKKEGILILAGRTLDMDEGSFGIVVFKAASEEDARILMESDPAILEGVMTSKLHHYRVALISEKNSK